MLKNVPKYLLETVLSVLLCFLVVLIWVINLSHIPDFYVTDMYTDIIYATEFWEHGSIFPDGWIFGNQFYVIATPVLAGLIYGIGFDPVMAMGLASSIMSILVVAAFYWMISPFFSCIKERLFVCVMFILLPLVGGDAVYHLNGWQLLFTMCSYYACYAISAFLSFGFYIRYWNTDKKINWLYFTLICLLAFFAGIQSLRQTVIQVMPLIAIEVFRVFSDICKKRKLFDTSFIIVAGISCSNLMGVLYNRFMDVDAVQIFGELSIETSFITSFKEAIINFLKLYYSVSPAFLVVGIIMLMGALGLVFLSVEGRNVIGCVLGAVLLFSVGIIGVIDVFTTMHIREIYYFMCYPLTAFLGGCLFSACAFLKKKRLRPLAQAVLIFVLCISCAVNGSEIINTIQDTNNQQYEEVSDYLLENGYTTIYSRWNLAEKIAIASDMNIQAGFWDKMVQPFAEVR